MFFIGVMELVETLILSKFFSFFDQLCEIRNTSGGHFNTIQSNFEYRETFKQSLRKYERSTSRHRAPRPIFSAVLGQRKKDTRAYKDINLAFQKGQEEKNMR